MARQAKARAVKIPLAACPQCRLAYETRPGGRDCPECGEACITAVVILPRERATITEAAGLLIDVLARMAAASPAR